MIWQQMRRGLVLVLVSLFLLGSAGVLYQVRASAQDAVNFTAPGTIIRINGQAMHLYCVGEGRPTVILESGVGGNTLLWGYIQPVLGEQTRVCSYDRAGYGWSEATSAARTTPQMVDELYGLLMEAAIQPPYVLVGHSFGGLVVRTFANRYPQAVVGLVLLDAAHPVQFSPEPCSPGCFPGGAVTLVDSFYAMLPSLARTGLVRLLVPSGVLPLPFFAVPEAFPQRAALLAHYSANRHSDTVLAEWRAFPENARTVTAIAPFENLPVQVITALNSYREQPLPGQDAEVTTQLWSELQADLLNISTTSQHYIIDEATHFSLLANPNHAASVTHQLTEMVDKVR
jgi:pimeloyl-ACP methyl ester carboxylesterase